MTKRILVTGGSGFVGGAVARRLAGQQKVWYTYRSRQPDIADAIGLRLDTVDPELADITHLVHAAAHVPERGQQAGVWHDFDTAVMANLALLKDVLSRLPKLQHIVFVGSCYAALDEASIGFYGVGKRMVEDAVHQAARMLEIDSVSVRFPQLYGPGETHGMYLNRFAQAAVTGEPVTLDARASTQRDALYIDDAVSALVAAMDVTGHETIVVSSDEPVSGRQAAEEVARQLPLQLSLPESFATPPPALHFASSYQKHGFAVQYNLSDGIAQTIKYYKGM